jgi:hypothetical protein
MEGWDDQLSQPMPAGHSRHFNERPKGEAFKSVKWSRYGKQLEIA